MYGWCVFAVHSDQIFEIKICWEISKFPVYFFCHIFCWRNKDLSLSDWFSPWGFFQGWLAKNLWVNFYGVHAFVFSLLVIFTGCLKLFGKILSSFKPMQNRLKWKTQIVHLNQQAVNLSFSTGCRSNFKTFNLLPFNKCQGIEPFSRWEFRASHKNMCGDCNPFWLLISRMG